MPCYDCGDYWECDGEGGECQGVRVLAFKKRNDCTGEIEGDIELDKPNQNVTVGVEAGVELRNDTKNDRWDLVPWVTLDGVEVNGRGNGGASAPHGRQWQLNAVVEILTSAGNVKFRVQAYVYPQVDPKNQDNWLLSPKVWIDQLGQPTPVDDEESEKKEEKARSA